MSDQNKAIYESAIFLNNVGVDLLERNCVLQDLPTLKDAVKAMHSIFQFRYCPPGAVPENTVVAVQDMIQRANKRRAFPAPTGSSLPTYYRIVNLSDNYNDMILHEGGTSLKQEPPTMDAIYPIRIDDVSTDIYSPGALNDSDVHAAILLHNLGLANLCLARLESISRTAWLHQAMNIFHYAGSVLEQRCDEFQDEVCLRQATCIKMAILVGVLRAATAMCYEDAVHCSKEEGQEIETALYDLGESVKVLDESLEMYTHDVNCALAA